MSQSDSGRSAGSTPNFEPSVAERFPEIGGHPFRELRLSVKLGGRVLEQRYTPHIILFYGNERLNGIDSGIDV